MKDQKLTSMLVKGCIAAFVIACFTVTVQAAPAFQEPQHKMSKMNDKKKDKMSHDKMSGQKMHKMSDGKMGTKKMDKMSKDTTGKM